MHIKRKKYVMHCTESFSNVRVTVTISISPAFLVPRLVEHMLFPIHTRNFNCYNGTIPIKHLNHLNTVQKAIHIAFVPHLPVEAFCCAVYANQRD